MLRRFIAGIGCALAFGVSLPAASARQPHPPFVLALSCRVSGGGYAIMDADGHVRENGDGVPFSPQPHATLLVTAAPPRVRVAEGSLPHPDCASGPALESFDPVRFAWCAAHYEILPSSPAGYVLRSASRTAMKDGPHRGDVMEAFMVGECRPAGPPHPDQQDDADAEDAGCRSLWRGGHASSMAKLTELEAHIPVLRRYAQALLRDDGEADDLVQGCLVRALDHLPTRTGDGDMRPWLFSIMHNLFASRWRRLRRRAPVLVEAPGADAAVPPAQAHATELHEVLRRLDALPEQQRAALLLVAVKGLDYAAAVLKIPVGTVMSRLSRARDKLKHAAGQAPRPALRRVK